MKTVMLPTTCPVCGWQEEAEFPCAMDGTPIGSRTLLCEACMLERRAAKQLAQAKTNRQIAEAIRKQRVRT